MPNFKNFLAVDVSTTFFNTNEFAEEVVIDGKSLNVIIDDNRLKDRGAKEYNGLTTGMILYFIPVFSFSNKPKVGNTQIFNGRLMHIDDVRESAGIYEVIITQNRGE